MKIKSLVIDAHATCGDFAIATAVRPKFKYENGQRLNEQDGYTITCVLPEHGYEELVVAVPAVPAELEQLTGNPIVHFDALLLSLYLNKDKEYKISAKANAVHIVDNKDKS